MDRAAIRTSETGRLAIQSKKTRDEESQRSSVARRVSVGVLALSAAAQATGQKTIASGDNVCTQFSST